MLYAIAYATFALALVADFIATKQGIARGAKESSAAKSNAMRAVVGAVCLLSFAMGIWGDPEWAARNQAWAVPVLFGLAALRGYAAWHNTKVNR